MTQTNALHNGSYDHDGTLYHNGETVLRDREYFYEFNLPEMRFRNASITLRPDAISSDYLTSFTVGPQEQGDVSGGILNRLWKTRVDNAQQRVFVAKANNSFNGK